MIMVRICDVFFFFFPISESLYQVEFFRWDKFSKYRSIRILRISRFLLTVKGRIIMIMMRICDVFFFLFFPISEPLYQVGFFKGINFPNIEV